MAFLYIRGESEKLKFFNPKINVSKIIINLFSIQYQVQFQPDIEKFDNLITKK